MDYSNSPFLSPLTIRGKTWRNRSVSAPMGGIMMPNGDLDPMLKNNIDYFSQGEVAEYIIGETDVNLEGCRGGPMMYTDLHEPGLHETYRKCASYIHEKGALAFVELSHCGNEGFPFPGVRVVGPVSYIRESDGAEIHGMTEEDIASTVADFAYAASMLKETGFDGVVIHAGHGWLIHQFLSSVTNRRTDRFGGSVENRARFLIMVLDAVRASCGEDFVIEVRYSGLENRENAGYSLEESCEFAKLMSEHCDIIHVSAGIYHDPSDTMMISSMYDDHMCNLPAAAAIKKCIDIPVSVVGGFNSAAQFDDVIRTGKADLVVCSRQRMADPFFIPKMREGRADEIRGCLRCMRCFPGPADEVVKEEEEAKKKGKPFLFDPQSCTVNPSYKHGALSSFPPVQRKKRVLVVGGGCGGMQAAITAHDRGHDVTLIEKSDTLGGILNFAAEDRDKHDLKALADTMAAELRYRKVDVRLGTSFSEELLRQIGPDAVIAAVGAEVNSERVPGLDGENVISAADVYQKGRRFGGKAVVVGAGLVGCETAVHIARTGTPVTLIAKYDELCEDAYRLHKLKLRRLIRDLGCEVILRSICTKVLPDGVLVSTDGGEERFVAAETVVNALGMRPVSVDGIRTACEGMEFHAIGDCAGVRNIFSATDEGYMTAVSL